MATGHSDDGGGEVLRRWMKDGCRGRQHRVFITKENAWARRSTSPIVKGPAPLLRPPASRRTHSEHTQKNSKNENKQQQKKGISDAER